MSYLEIVLGPMFAGKTSKLIRTYNHLQKSENVVAVNHTIDVRYGNNVISSHDNIKIPCLMIDDLFDAWFNSRNINYDELRKNEYIFINEAQFFSDLYYTVSDMLNNNKKVFLYGLDGDFKQEKFGEILDLIPLCDSIEKLNSRCIKCGGKSIFTNRITNNKEQISVGVDTYIPVCRSCNLEQHKDPIVLD